MSEQTKFVIQSITLSLLLCATLAFGAEPGAQVEKVVKEDTDFVKEAASGGMIEVQLGKTAQENASKSQVKEFGRRMQTDHSKANNDLKKIAAKKDIKLPTELERQHKSTVDKLSKLKGDEFDREYMSTMVSDHREVIEKFQDEAEKGEDPDVKQSAKDNLPVLKKHLALAEEIRKQISVKSK